MRYLMILVLLSGCAYTHEPALTSPPTDQAKYQQDLSYCRSEGMRRVQAAANHSEGRAATAFGLLGAAVAHDYDGSDNPDYHKNAMQITDECLREKGYSVN